MFRLFEEKGLNCIFFACCAIAREFTLTEGGLLPIRNHFAERCNNAILKGSNIGFSALNNGKTVRKACQGCALCGVPPPKWPSIPEDAALSNIS